MNQQFPFFNFNTGAFMPGQQVPRVKGLEEAKNYPCPPNTEVILKDADDDTILYFKKTDANGYCTVDRHRHYPDPEPTQQEINDQRYVSAETFNKFKEEILDAINRSSFSSESTVRKHDANSMLKQQSGTNGSPNGKQRPGN